MKALEILKNASSIKGFSEMQLIISKDKLDEAIKELEALTTIQQTNQHKFNVGDWVVYSVGVHGSEEILQITNIDKNGFCSFSNCCKLYQIDKLKLWKPKPDEWCWVFNDEIEIPTISKFVCIDNNATERDYEKNVIISTPYIVERKDGTGTIPYRYIEPFIGSLPSIIKQ